MTVFRFKAIVAYDGTAYAGFQRQRGQATVQAELEQAIAAISGSATGILAAGRTDAGVHARGQVIAFDLRWRHGPAALLRALNANLAVDVAVTDLSVAATDFHPRFDARRRRYRYQILNQAVRDPLMRRQSWHVSSSLDLQALRRAASLLVGRHDFATFGQPPQGSNTEREVYLAEWQGKDSLIIFTIEANAFLYRMVRSLVGSLKLVGTGDWTVDEFGAALAARDRSRAGQTAPPQGLALLSVTYDGDIEERSR
ncbi:MAG: tRNA pseudouridine(38-40) synthase TruA [Candidatus Promineifilaceae bacterium]|nr:tRNA pseudouridine(38-40) synthase TruA [Candidatus Promineifilaceae bacterium]